jgi:hypothetical protein
MDERQISKQTRQARGRGGNPGQGGGRGWGSGAGQGGGRGRGGGNKPGSGPGGNCVCPRCGRKTPHAVGQRCADRACPDCGTRMIRE